MTPPGRLLAVDFGTVRVGLAVSDPERRFSLPLETYARRTLDLDSAHFAKLTASERIALLVVGLPVHMSGDEGEKARAARAFGTWLAGVCKLPVNYYDERFTSQAADDALRGTKLTKQQRQARRDRIAAQILLQSYIDAGCPADALPAPIDPA